MLILFNNDISVTQGVNNELETMYEYKEHLVA